MLPDSGKKVAMFKHILIPLDGSTCAECALPVAVRIAGSTNAKITLVRVAALPERAPLGVPPDIEQQLLKSEFDVAKKYLKAIATSGRLPGLLVETTVLTGSTAPALLDAALSLHADLIIMCSHGYAGFKRQALGSVAQHVARHSSVPTLILRAGGSVPTNIHPGGLRPVCIMVALDGSKRAEAMLLPAAYVGKALSAPAPAMLHLVRIVPWPTAEDDRQPEQFPAARAWAESEAKTYLERVKKQLREENPIDSALLLASSVIIHADVAETLIRAAETGEYLDNEKEFQGCDIIALATQGRSGFQRWAVGSVAEQILGATRLPLLIIRPTFGEEDTITFHKHKRSVKRQDSSQGQLS
jgi:nucleotide-binding universal stress UspA family protein